MSPAAEKGEDALPDRRRHQLPGSLHLYGGAAHSLLPLPVSEVSRTSSAPHPPAPPIPNPARFKESKPFWSREETLSIFIQQM